MTKTATAPLTGKALLQKIKEGGLSKRELAREAGYYTATKERETRVNLAEFYDAVLAARGIALDPEASKDRRGKEATYRVSVHHNGSIVIGSSYTESIGIKARR